MSCGPAAVWRGPLVSNVVVLHSSTERVYYQVQYLYRRNLAQSLRREEKMTRRVSYGQFCPVAKACEVFAERWTPLILREMFMGSQRFSDIHRGVPLMSRSLLSKRLQELERAEVIERTDSGSGYDVYRLTPAGEELRPIVVQLGNWGKQWTRSEMTPRDLDVGLLMWDMRRRIDYQQLPEERVVVHFQYHDAPQNRRRWWLVLNHDEADLCLVDPGLEPDLYVITNVRTMTGIWMGDLSYGTALQTRDLQIEGPAALRARLPSWLRLSMFAEVERRIS
jgi:DNA-binding HxlR family transcriptional regulator